MRVRGYIARALIFSVVATVSRLCPAIADDKPHTVCEVLSNLDRYRGKLIAIEGILGGGTRHGQFLRNDAQDKECIRVQQKGYAWPADIALTQFSAGSEIEDGPAPFESDSAHIHQILAEPKRVAAGRKDTLIIVTAVGELRARKDIKITRSSDGTYYGDGYGQGGQYPAMLVLKTITDARVAKRDSSDRD